MSGAPLDAVTEGVIAVFTANPALLAKISLKLRSGLVTRAFHVLLAR
jgi:hypothetical protein